jgi:hypothetical protein
MPGLRGCSSCLFGLFWKRRQERLGLTTSGPWHRHLRPRFGSSDWSTAATQPCCWWQSASSPWRRKAAAIQSCCAIAWSNPSGMALPTAIEAASAPLRTRIGSLAEAVGLHHLRAARRAGELDLLLAIHDVDRPDAHRRVAAVTLRKQHPRVGDDQLTLHVPPLCSP